MSNYWITTIWPFVQGDARFCCHVFLKGRRKSYPGVGDVIFFRESISVPSKTITRFFRGESSVVQVREGTGGIVAMGVVCDFPVSIPPYPDWVVVSDYGNLNEWDRVIQCDNHAVGYRMSWEELSSALKLKNGRPLSLYQVFDPALIESLLRG